MTKQKEVLIPLPDRDFDTTEVAIPWKTFVEAGLKVTFSTETGNVGQTDPRLLTGVIFGQLGAKPEAIAAYRELEMDEAFRHPIPYESILPQEFDLLLLPGGHAKGMRQYLESKDVQNTALEFIKQNKVVGAICHGVLVLARTIDPDTGRSVLYGRKLTGLTKRLERAGYYLTFWRLGDYYRTYPEYVEDETVNALKERSDFLHGGSIREPFVVEDGNLISARYPADAHLFAQKLVDRVKMRE
ncbi:MAG TPA: type 1 glutamine amidotransferase domain-containing protein [Ktedonobacteraceae bacterium]|nr:type 1 glutamine amidotransferase domain-containing protein [Ktedonobacteraceae bacterium]